MLSRDLRKYESFTGEYLGYKPSVLEQTRFDYFPLVNIFNNWLDEKDKKEGLLQRVINIEDKSEKQLQAIKDLRIKQLDIKKTKTKNDLSYDSNHNFYKYRLRNFLQISSTESEFDELEMFYRDFISLKFLDASPEKRNYKSTVLNNASNLYNNEFIPDSRKVYESGSKNNKSYGWKQKYDLRNLKALDYQPAKLKTESLSDEDKLGLTQLTKLKQISLNEISKVLWIKASGNDLNFLIKDVVNNLDSNN